MNRLIIAGIIVAAAMTRLIPHPPNFTPIIAMGLFGGALLDSRKIALLVPITAMVIADYFLGFHSTMIWVYSSLILITMLAKVLQNRISVGTVALATLSGSLLFFILTNFGVWMVEGFYPHTFTGLAACYQAAIPFFANSIAGDVFYSAILFGGYALLKQFVPALGMDAIHK